jgi:hypothetical protein
MERKFSPFEEALAIGFAIIGIVVFTAIIIFAFQGAY